MSTRTEAVDRSPLVVLLAALLAVGLAKAGARVVGLLALLGVVAACVGALTIGVLVLRLAVLR